MNPSLAVNTPSLLKGLNPSTMTQAATQSVVRLPLSSTVPAASPFASIGEPPPLGPMPIGKSDTPQTVRLEAPAQLGQDVRDRDIAHIATGGIGNAQSRR
jgi:hypothetical protein